MTGIQSVHPEGSVASCFPEDGNTFLATDKTAERCAFLHLSLLPCYQTYAQKERLHLKTKKQQQQDKKRFQQERDWLIRQDKMNFIAISNF